MTDETQERITPEALSRPTSSDAFLLDCKGREIRVGDVIRVKHFQTRHGRGWKQHWMYKHVVGKVALGKGDYPALKIRSLQDPSKPVHEYYEKRSCGMRDDIEIVDGLHEENGRIIAFDERPRFHPNTKLTDPKGSVLRQGSANSP